MIRRARLKRTGGLSRRTRIRPVSDRRRRRDLPYPDARQAVYDRAGGRRGPDPHRLSNLLACCFWCHGQIHRHPAWSYEHGLMTYRNGGDA